MIRAILFVTAIFIIFFFLVYNKDLMVPVQYYPGGMTKPIPFYLLILGTFLSGLILSVILIFPGWLKLKLETRRQKKEIESLEEEVGHLRIASPSSPSPSRAPSGTPGPS